MKKKRVVAPASSGCWYCDKLIPYGYLGCPEHARQVQADIIKTPVARKTVEVPDVGHLRGTARDFDGRVFYAVKGRGPIALASLSPADVLQWAEDTRDSYEDGGRIVTVGALKLLATSALAVRGGAWADDSVVVCGILDQLYPHEAEGRTAADEAFLARPVTKNALDGSAPPKKGADAPKTDRGTVAKIAIDIKNDTKIEAAAVSTGSGAKRFNIFGHVVTAVIRWMGAHRWTVDQAQRAIAKIGLPVAPATVQAQIRGGMTGTRGEPADLTEDQIAALEALIKEPKKCLTQKSSGSAGVKSSRPAQSAPVSKGSASKKPKVSSTSPARAVTSTPSKFAPKTGRPAAKSGLKESSKVKLKSKQKNRG